VAVERPIAVIGAGLAGSLAALALARRGVSVTLVAPAAAADPVLATGLSYGGMLPGRPVCHWRRLERRHGRLGLCGSGLVLHGLGALRLPLPFWRVDAPTLMAALPAALDRVAVERLYGTVRALEPLPEGGYRDPVEVARERVAWIRANHHPEPLEAAQRAELGRILAAADRELGEA